MRKPRYSFVVPVFNEQETLPLLFARMSDLMGRLDGASELIMIDDGSTDNSAALIRTAAERDRRIKILQLSRNFGHQIAITAGTDFAGGDAVVIMDADLQDPPEVVLEMADKWRAGFHVVYGVRTARAGESRFKRMTAKLFYRLMRLLVAVPVVLEAGDFRLIDRRALRGFRSLREHNRFVRGMWAWVGFRQTAVYFERPRRALGETKYPFRKMLQLAVHGIIAFSDIPLQLTIWAGALISLLSVLYGGYVTILWLRGADLVAGWSSLIVIVSLLGGVQLIVLGIVGLYVGRIHEEVKNRPLYIASAVSGFQELPEIERAVVLPESAKAHEGGR